MLPLLSSVLLLETEQEPNSMIYFLINFDINFIYFLIFLISWNMKADSIC